MSRSATCAAGRKAPASSRRDSNECHRRPRDAGPPPFGRILARGESAGLWRRLKPFGGGTMGTMSRLRACRSLLALVVAMLLATAQPISAVPGGGQPDRTAPVTQARGLPASGWASGDVTVTLSATDSGSGVAYTRFSVDGSAPQTYTTPLAFTTEGTSTIKYWSVDKASPANVEATKTALVRIDRVAPALTLT
ncbi:MAG: hypothetical protein FDZ75_08015, partial [Actinobacteria bacterium]